MAPTRIQIHSACPTLYSNSSRKTNVSGARNKIYISRSETYHSRVGGADRFARDQFFENKRENLYDKFPRQEGKMTNPRQDRANRSLRDGTDVTRNRGSKCRVFYDALADKPPFISATRGYRVIRYSAIWV